MWKSFISLAMDFCEKSRYAAAHPSTQEMFRVLAAAYGKLTALPPPNITMT